MITTKDNLELANIDENKSKEIYLGEKKLRVKRMANSIAKRQDRYVAEAEQSYSEDKKMLIVNMSKNRDLIPKCLSLMILHSWFKVTFFHWIYWRYLSNKYPMEDLSKALKDCAKLNDAGFFFDCMGFLQVNNQMIQKMSEKNMYSIAHDSSLQANMKSSKKSMGA